jgi:hypothetical protein
MKRGAGAAGDCLRDTARVPERELAPEAPDLAAEDADMPSADVDCKLSSPVRATFLLGGFIVRSELPEPLSLSLLLREVGLHAASGLLQTPVARRDAADEGRRETRLQTESFQLLKILLGGENVARKSPLPQRYTATSDNAKARELPIDPVRLSGCEGRPQDARKDPPFF